LIFYMTETLIIFFNFFTIFAVVLQALFFHYHSILIQSQLLSTHLSN
ncbi:hypothetical protein LCGC14_0595970, partial [marine sediment metagenome]